MVYLLFIVSLLFVFLGGYIVLKPEDVSLYIKNFYRSYPIVRYVGDKQLTSRRGVIRLLGFVLIFVSLWYLVYAIKNPHGLGEISWQGKEWETVTKP